MWRDTRDYSHVISKSHKTVVPHGNNQIYQPGLGTLLKSLVAVLTGVSLILSSSHLHKVFDIYEGKNGVMESQLPP